MSASAQRRLSAPTDNNATAGFVEKKAAKGSKKSLDLTGCNE
jgi:hypothetical protein